MTESQVAKLLARLVSTLTGAFGWAAGRRGWVLREPDEVELAEMTEPVARILHRHVPLDWINEDIIDLTLATEAFVGYVRTEPLFRATDAYTDPAAAAADDLTPGYQEPR